MLQLGKNFSHFCTPFYRAIKGVRKWSRQAEFSQADGISAYWHDEKIAPAAPFLHSVLSGNLRGVRKWSRQAEFSQFGWI